MVAGITSVEAPESSAETPKPDKHLAHVSVPCHFPNQLVSTGRTGDGVCAPEDAHHLAGQSSCPSALQDSVLQQSTAAQLLGRACSAGG